MTLRALAGYSMEESLWKMLYDISSQLQGKTISMKGIDPDMIIIENEDFCLTNHETVSPLFSAPEEIASEAAVVWSLGALVCYASSGHLIFGGQGSDYQKKHPSVALPILQKKHSSLTPLVQHCLAYNSENRIKIKELVIESKKGLEQCKKKVRGKSVEKNRIIETNTIEVNERWPEEMTNNN